MNLDLLAEPKPALLRAGDRLTRDEFHRRYLNMPDLKKAELVEGIVYTYPRVSITEHGGPHADLNGWLWSYQLDTDFVDCGVNSTVKLDANNELQPDVLMRIPTKYGGQTRIVDGYIEGPPELVAEVSPSITSIDSNEKKEVYRRNGVREYLVWRVLDQVIDWFVLQNSVYQKIHVDSNGLLRSHIFPGLWLDPVAMINEDMVRINQVIRLGLASRERQEFINHFQAQ